MEKFRIMDRGVKLIFFGTKKFSQKSLVGLKTEKLDFFWKIFESPLKKGNPRQVWMLQKC